MVHRAEVWRPIINNSPQDDWFRFHISPVRCRTLPLCVLFIISFFDTTFIIDHMYCKRLVPSARLLIPYTIDSTHITLCVNVVLDDGRIIPNLFLASPSKSMVDYFHYAGASCSRDA